MTITALVIPDKRIADIIKRVEVASALLISLVGSILVRVLRPYALQPSRILSEGCYSIGKLLEGFIFMFKITWSCGISKFRFERVGDRKFLRDRCMHPEQIEATKLADQYWLQ